jgi:hypothetical protein
MRCKQFKGKRKYTQPSEKKGLKVEENMPLYAMVIRESLESLVGVTGKSYFQLN